MRITSRTPPVRLAAERMVAIAAMPPEQSGLLLRWGMSLYAGGGPVPVTMAQRYAGCDDDAWRTLMRAVHDQIDQEALADGGVVVIAFADALRKLADVSASKVRAPRVAREEVAATGTHGVVATIDRRPVAARTEPPAADAVERAEATPPVDAGPWEGIAGTLVAMGASAAEVEPAIAGWREEHVAEEVVDALSLLANRRIAHPVRYLGTILSKSLASRRLTMPTQIRMASQGPLLPRAVKRKIAVPPRSGWTFEGWTARGHARGGVTLEDRREVWRDDSGTLSYKRPDPATAVPSYEKDPGVYEGE